jgi:hypothetical protein
VVGTARVLPVRNDRRTLVRVVALVFALNVASPNAVVTDSVRVVPVAQRILTTGTIRLPGNGPEGTGQYGTTQVGSHVYPLFPWTISLFLLPAVAAKDALHAVGVGSSASAYGSGSPEDWPLEVLTMSVVVAATAGVLFLAGAELADPDDEARRRRSGLIAAVVFALATSAWSTASRSAWQHGPSMLFLASALLVALRSRRQPLAAGWFGAMLAAALIVRPTNAVPVAVLALWALVAHRDRWGRALLAALAVLLPFAAVNLASYHALLPPYFLGNSFHTHPRIVEALVGNLISPARGLLVFSPVLALAAVGLWRRRREGRFDGLDVAMGTTVVLHWVVVSRLDHWWGGYQYGPRLFTDVVPFLVLMAVPVIDNAFRDASRRPLLAAGTAALLLWSVFANAEGALFRSTTCWNVTPDVDSHPGRVWSWSDPQVLAGVKGVLRHGLASELTRGGYAPSNLTACPGVAGRPTAQGSSAEQG